MSDNTNGYVHVGSNGDGTWTVYATGLAEEFVTERDFEDFDQACDYALSSALKCGCDWGASN